MRHIVSLSMRIKKRCRLHRGDSRVGRLFVFRRRLGLRRRLLLLELLLLFLFRHVVADRAAGGGTQDGMMAGDVASHGTDSGALETTFGHGAL